jgi:peptide/nickel transport system substrate-binding protein
MYRWTLALILAFGLAQAHPSTLVTALPPATRITYLLPIEPDPYYTNVNGEVAELLYKPLIWINRKGEIDYARSIATSVKTPDGEHYFIRLNPKWHWSDGVPVTSADVLFWLNLVRSIPLSKESLYGGWGGGGIPNDVVGDRALGPYALEITLNRPYSSLWFIENGLGYLEPLPKHAWDRYPGHPARTLAWLEARGDNLSFFRHSPVDGPFMVGTFVNNLIYTFKANPHYDGHRPAYTTLALRYFTTSDAEYQALRSGQVQVGYLPLHLFEERNIPGYRFAAVPSWSFNYIYINFANPKAPFLKELAVRQALQMAINEPGMIRSLLHGQGVADYAPAPFAPPTPYLDPRLRQGWVPYPYDPSKGRKILERVGWRLVHGIMRKGAAKLSLSLDYASGSTLAEQEAELVAEAAAREGIQIQLRPQPFDTLTAELSSSRRWTLVYLNEPWYAFYPTSYGLLNSQAAYNLGSYRNPEMDRLTEATHAYGSLTAQLAALHRYQEYAALRVPVLWMPDPYLLYEVSDSLVDVVRHISPNGNWSPQYWSYRHRAP